MFEGRKELFDGLWIAEHGQWDWKEHPIITVDFNELARDTPENLKQSLEQNQIRIAGFYGLSVTDSPLPVQFTELMLALRQKTGMQVAVLIENLIPEALLFQTGCLTIADIQGSLYTLNYPNKEVKSGFIQT